MTKILFVLSVVGVMFLAGCGGSGGDGGKDGDDFKPTDFRHATSPDGRFIAFARTRYIGDGTVTNDIWIKNADSTGEFKTEQSSVEASQPVWSLDSKFVAWVDLSKEGSGGYTEDTILDLIRKVDVETRAVTTVCKETALTGDIVNIQSWNADRRIYFEANGPDGRENLIFSVRDEGGIPVYVSGAL